MAKKTRKTNRTSASKGAAKKVKKETPSSQDKLQSLNYIDGKINVEQIQDLEKLVGIRETNPYGTTSLEVLTARIADMNMWEMQEFAVKVGVFPSGNRTVLKNKLTKEFLAYNKGKGRHIVLPSPKQIGSNLSPEELAKVLDLTKRGL